MCDPTQSNGCEYIEYGMKNYLNTSVRLQMKINPFPWNAVPEYLEKNLKNLFKGTDDVTFPYFFTEALKHHTCENSAIFTAIMDIFTVIRLQARDYSDILRYRTQDQLQMILYHLNQKNGQSIFLEQECIPIIEVLSAGHDKFIEILATHGCYADVWDNSSFARRQASAMIGRFLCLILDHASLSPVLRTINYWCRRYTQCRDDSEYSVLRRDYATALAQLNSSPSSLEPNETPDTRFSPLIRFFLDPSSIPEDFSVKRIFLVILGINVLSLKLEGYRRDYMSKNYLGDSVKTLEIYFRTINEPYLNVTEVRKLFTGCIFDESKRHLVDEWCQIFEDVIPFCTKNYEPRKLSHLCRCQVRQNYYGSVYTLPAVIDKLNLPKAIQDFLLCRSLEKSPERLSRSPL